MQPRSFFLSKKIPTSQALLSSNLSYCGSSSNLLSPYQKNMRIDSNSMKSLHMNRRYAYRKQKNHYERTFTSSYEIQQNNEQIRDHTTKEKNIFKNLLSKAINKNQDLSKLLELKETQYAKLRKINTKLMKKTVKLGVVQKQVQMQQEAISQQIAILNSKIEQLSTTYKKSIASQKKSYEQDKNRLQKRIAALREQHQQYSRFINSISIDLKAITSYPSGNLKKLWKQWEKIFEKISQQNS